MDVNMPDFSEADNAKLETRFMLNAFSFMAINLFRKPNFDNYKEGHSVLNFMEMTLLGYTANRSSDKFKELATEFNERKQKIPKLKVLNGSIDYLELLYSYNLKRYHLVRLLMTRYNLDKFKNKSTPKD
tara:strand:+ start:191 stop:577 length:387 start_codon:yes stop_codon:yes gene_type:complete